MIMPDKKDILRKRIRILSRGILPPIIDGQYLPGFASIGLGAGPQGRRFYILDKENQKPAGMISVPIHPENHHLAPYALRTTLGEIPGTLVTEDGTILKSCPFPGYVNKSASEGKIIPVMMHCYNTAATVMGFSCRHFEENEECRYCEIESVGKNIINLPGLHSIDDFADGLSTALKYEHIRSLTITSGTFAEPDEVAKYFVKLLKRIREITDISIHIQLEPVVDYSLLEELSGLSQSVGIFLEIFNEDIRKEICPGKSKKSKETYIKNWEHAVQYYGAGNVTTTCILGFGVDHGEILNNIEDFAKIGVRTSILFLRAKSRKLENYIPVFLTKSEDELMELHIKAIEIMKKYRIIFSKKDGLSGCIGCQGCTAMMEASELVE
jgi:pyruvate-formate lyase-activating enzyme